MSATALIPLFPLELVVFPGQLLSLHIFEQRYKTMIADCRAGDLPFGICLVQGGEACAVGCALTIQEILREYPDGRLDLVAAGLRRYRVRATYEDQPYLSGLVEYFDDGAELMDPELAGAAEERFLQLLALVGAESGLPQAWSSFHLAQRLDFSLEERQELLENTSENARLRALIKRLDLVLPAMEQRRELRRRAQGNGHLKN
ncbi:MAG: LON peptidase substrate-binding domain-containing protein [Candidatus Handelsmanbacteria bacterium]|nr:LON peptidase substrate-binding domain-containing protein [Candidatus Handelsmanbacteria bacterium]